MAYFSNGTEGMMYEEQFCDKCVHQGIDSNGEGKGCPIWNAHFMYNYDAAGNETAKGILEMLIPTRSDGLFADECSMFQETIDDGQMNLFGGR